MGYLELARKHLQQWDEPAALGLFRAALGRIRRRFPADCIGWAKENQPELWRAVLETESRFNQAFHRQDMAGVRQAVAEYERAFNELISTYQNKRVLTTGGAIAAFGCDRVWNLLRSRPLSGVDS